MRPVDHVIEPATSGRAKCRGCGKNIAKGVVRFGERVDNPFGDGKTTLWFHLPCAAYKRPEPFLEALGATTAPLEEHGHLEATARMGTEHRRLPRVDGVERASTGRAACRCCREAIAKGTLRIRLVFFQDGRFDPGGFIHVHCAEAHLGTADILERLRQFSPALTPNDIAELRETLSSEGRTPAPEP